MVGSLQLGSWTDNLGLGFVCKWAGGCLGVGYRRLALETAMRSADLCAFPVVQCWRLKYQLGVGAGTQLLPVFRWTAPSYFNLPFRAQG